MANSKYDFHKDDEKATDLTFNRGTYIIIRIDGDKFHHFCHEHNFEKPNDKRALDLMIHAAKVVMRTYKGHIPLAYGHSDEFSFMIRSDSDLLSRRIFKITSMLPVVFATAYNSNWDKFFSNPSLGTVVKRKYDAWFDAKPKEYPNYQAVIDYFRWRQVDCHINNLYNTTLHALTGRYMRHELIEVQENEDLDPSETFSDGSENSPRYRLKRTSIQDWILDKTNFMSSREATEKLSKTVSSDKHEIMFSTYKINYNKELEQFKKGTVIVDTQVNFDDKNNDSESIRHYNIELVKDTTFWIKHNHIFDDLKKLQWLTSLAK